MQKESNQKYLEKQKEGQNAKVHNDIERVITISVILVIQVGISV